MDQGISLWFLPLPPATKLGGNTLGYMGRGGIGIGLSRGVVGVCFSFYFFLFFSLFFIVFFIFFYLLICFKSSYRYNAHFTRYWTSNGETNDFCHKRISGAGVWKVWDLGYWKSKVRDSIVTNFKDSRFLVQLTQLKKINMKATLEYVNSMLTGEWKIAY